MDSTKERIERVGKLAYDFGVLSAGRCKPGAIAPQALSIHLMQFQYGAVRWLGEHLDPDAPLADEDIQAAMGYALTLQGGAADGEAVRRAVKALDEAADELAQRLRREGAAAAKAWDGGENDDATEYFQRLIEKNPDLFTAE